MSWPWPDPYWAFLLIRITVVLCDGDYIIVMTIDLRYSIRILLLFWLLLWLVVYWSYLLLIPSKVLLLTYRKAWRSGIDDIWNSIIGERIGKYRLVTKALHWAVFYIFHYSVLLFCGPHYCDICWHSVFWLPSTIRNDDAAFVIDWHSWHSDTVVILLLDDWLTDHWPTLQIYFYSIYWLTLFYLTVTFYYYSVGIVYDNDHSAVTMCGLLSIVNTVTY